MRRFALAVCVAAACHPVEIELEPVAPTGPSLPPTVLGGPSGAGARPERTSTSYAVLVRQVAIPTPDDYDLPLETANVTCPDHSMDHATGQAPNYFTASLPQEVLDSLESRQRYRDSCWAASLEGILRYCGIDVTQQDLVGGPSVSHAGDQDIILKEIIKHVPGAHLYPSRFEVALGLAERVRFGGFSMPLYVFRDATDLAEDVALGVPVMLVVRETESLEHTFLLGAVRYSVGFNIRTIYREVFVFDPDELVGGWSWKSAAWLAANLRYVVRVKSYDKLAEETARCRLATAVTGEPAIKRRLGADVLVRRPD